ncbi:MAG: NAD-binding protein [SAR202 cluster bacterium]|nr:NAD-binding protein [SAR202 cluster bacterium]|tara:strand:+ start:133 stop:552 length:420 start_codon:yes stop_codon:yes gene_type:complete
MYYVIIGATTISVEIMDWLMKSGGEVTLIDQDMKKIQLIQSSHGDVCSLGDPLDIDDLTNAGLGRADMVISSLEHDYENLILSQVAKIHFSVDKVVSLLYSSENKDLFSMLGVDVLIEVPDILISNIQEKLGQFLIEEI